MPPHRSARWLKTCAVNLPTLTLALLLIACSGADNGDDAGATATRPSAATTIASERTSTSSSTSEPDATATTAPSEPPATAPPAVTATATAIPLPSVGAELRILGAAIERLVPGDEAGTVLYAITSNGISRSHDSGVTWVASGSVPEGQLIAALNDPDVLYAGREQACARGGGDAPLLRSTDGGLTWEAFTGGHGIRPLLIEAGLSSTLVGTSCQLQVSYDGGQSWMPIADTAGMDAYAAASSEPDALDDQVVVLAISEGGTSLAWLIDMRGDEPLLAAELNRFYGFGAVAWSGERIVIVTSTGVLVSEDSGASWIASRDGLEGATYSVDPQVEAIPADEQGRDFSFSVVRIDPDAPDRIWVAGANGAFQSIDGGQTWQQLGDAAAVDSLVLATTAQRVYVSSDGGTRVWTDDGE